MPESKPIIIGVSGHLLGGKDTVAAQIFKEAMVELVLMNEES